MGKLYSGIRRHPFRAWLIYNGRLSWQLQTWKPRFAAWTTSWAWKGLRRELHYLSHGESGETLSGGAVFVAFLAGLFLLAVALLFGWIRLPVPPDLMWLVKACGGRW